MSENKPAKQRKDEAIKAVQREQAELLRQELQAGHRQVVSPVIEPEKKDAVSA
ncbi:MAG: hypothetical protein M1484_03975 [Patescibacteria group bacterium]|nr:hypothetical protein [Patescibacteria group bacterium]MCL5432217.1 hypothetical protein [Patescibacteria group bacterium]